MAQTMTEQDFEDYLRNLLGSDQDGYEFYDEDSSGETVAEWGTVDVGDVGTFADKGILTRNKGLVVTMDDGSEFQVTIVRSK